GILRPGIDARVIPGALPQVAVLAHAHPVLPGVVGAENAAVVGFDDRPKALGIHPRNRHADDAYGSLRQTLGARDLFPGVAAVGAFPQSGARAAAFQAIGGAFHAPGGGIEDAWIIWVEDQVYRSDFVIDEKHILPACAAILAAEDAALLAGAEQVPQRRHIDQVG